MIRRPKKYKDLPTIIVVVGEETSILLFDVMKLNRDIEMLMPV
jgi:hypothetical protein